jgi:hypothetical protein
LSDKKHLTGKHFATDTDVKQAITSSLQTLDTDFFYALVQALVPWWKGAGRLSVTVRVYDAYHV